MFNLSLFTSNKWALVIHIFVYHQKVCFNTYFFFYRGKQIIWPQSDHFEFDSNANVYSICIQEQFFNREFSIFKNKKHEVYPNRHYTL